MASGDAMGPLLIVDPDPRLLVFLASELEREGHAVVTATSFRQADLAAESAPPIRLLITASKLADGSGPDLWRRLQDRVGPLPAVLVCGSGDPPDAAGGGAADDRLVRLSRPIDVDALLERIAELLGPDAGSRSDLTELELRVEDLVLRPCSGEVRRSGHLIDLSNRETELLACLMSTPGEPLAPERLLGSVWGEELRNDLNLLDLHMRYLQQKIDRGGPALLHRDREGRCWIGERQEV
ncbi:response regulator transcription factor [Synechococcus sp. RSCCF101]|uniref:response regulator transcription factor n=1 Tax=Synechococcus sp. RSCCF101 TaxID=2511069 RepID=UPI0012448C8A|nr:winged helix-turn-helix domain-containing protein [Synechococcus sp. RSCCF101]QEY30931.1 response regulator transcription factor [Synechococcus sp. RSCCF101]